MHVEGCVGRVRNNAKMWLCLKGMCKKEYDKGEVHDNRML